MVTFKDLSDKFVICANGFDLGRINGVEINVNTWQVTHLHVKVSKSASEDLGFKKELAAQPYACLSHWFPKSETTYC